MDTPFKNSNSVLVTIGVKTMKYVWDLWTSSYSMPIGENKNIRWVEIGNQRDQLSNE